MDLNFDARKNRRISIIIPTYNREKDLERCLESFSIQTYPKDYYEILIIDDGSTDGTEGMIKKFLIKNNINLFYLKQEKNLKNIGKIRNLGIERSKGEIIAFTDSDCIVEMHWLMKINQEFEKKSTGGLYGKVEPLNTSGSISLKILSGIYLRKKFRKVTMNNFAVLKDIALSVEFNENLKITYEDVDFSQRCENLMKKKGLVFKKIDSFVSHDIKVQNIKDAFFFFSRRLAFRTGYGYIDYLKVLSNGIPFSQIPFFLRHLGIVFLPLVTFILFQTRQDQIPIIFLGSTIIFYLFAAFRSSEPFFPYFIFSPLYFFHSSGIIIGFIKRLWDNK